MGAFLAENRQADGAGGGCADPDFQMLVSWQVVDEPFAGRGGFAFVDVFGVQMRNLLLQLGDGLFTVFDARQQLIQITVEKSLKFVKLQEWDEPGIGEFPGQGFFQFQHAVSGFGFFSASVQPG